MYEKTEYFRIPIEGEESKYKLYLYGEGTYFEKLQKRQGQISRSWLQNGFYKTNHSKIHKIRPITPKNDCY